MKNQCIIRMFGTNNTLLPLPECCPRWTWLRKTESLPFIDGGRSTQYLPTPNSLGAYYFWKWRDYCSQCASSVKLAKILNVIWFNNIERLSMPSLTSIIADQCAYCRSSSCRSRWADQLNYQDRIKFVSAYSHLTRRRPWGAAIFLRGD